MQAASSGSRLRGWQADDPRMVRLREKRAAILEAAGEVFLREGWAATSLERVAAQGGFSKMTVYRHFGTKEELFEALVEGMCRELREQAEAEQPRPDLAPAIALEQLARQIVQGLIQPDALALYRLIVADGWRFPALARTFEQSGVAVLRRRVRDILESADLPGDESLALRSSGFINLVLGDAYLEAALGLDDPDQAQRFERQIAIATRFALAR
jgi:TetR/AcrR family transcriptional repressor of mexJK operon